MSQPTELLCTFDQDREVWVVWFPHPLGGMSVLETFNNQDEAFKFWQDQIDTADWDAE